MVGDVAEEDDDAVVGGAGGEIKPGIERFRIESDEATGDAVFHGAVVMLDEGGAGKVGVGEALPHVGVENITAGREDFLCAKVHVTDVVGVVD